jgi:hypothetical protein
MFSPHSKVDRRRLCSVKQSCALLLAGAVLSACSGSTAPSPGTFRAQLTGARVASWSGPSNAGVASSVEFPDQQFAIRMFAPRGDTIQTLGIRCPGEQPPGSGAHTLNPTGADCVGSYSRIVSTLEGGTFVLEIMAASSGNLTIGPSPEGQTTGTFDFSGPLIVGSDSVGTLEVSGAFSAELF